MYVFILAMCHWEMSIIKLCLLWLEPEWRTQVFFRENYPECENAVLRVQQVYFVHRVLAVDQVVLQAKLQRNEAALNMALVWTRHGQFDEVIDIPGSHHCGLSQHLAFLAFKDSFVTANGGYDVTAANSVFSNFPGRRRKAQQECQTVVHREVVQYSGLWARIPLQRRRQQVQ